MSMDIRFQGTGQAVRKRGQRVGLAARVSAIERALASAAWEAHREMFGPRQDHARAFPLELKVIIEPDRRWRLTADPSLEEQIRIAVRDMATQAAVYRSGRVYCYRCESSECPHSMPPRPSSVFGGYSSTGLPQWPELGQVLLNLRHPDVDMLYQPLRRHVFAAYMEPETLKHRQLDVFGRQSKTYDIFGQVVCGFLHLIAPGTEAEAKVPDHVALTLQAVESRHLDGSPRLEMNILGRLLDGSPAIDAFTGSYHLRILNIIADARRRIGHMAPRAYGMKPPDRLGSDVPARVAEILKGMARTLERIGRQTGRRTAHAEERRVDKRPTSKALGDVRAVPDAKLLWDDRRNTVVVLGPRNRIHIFNPQGRHITSLTLRAEDIENRLRRGRWQRLAGDLLERFRAVVVPA